MMPDIPIDRFDAALDMLVAGPGGIKDRLQAAWLKIVSLPETRLPSGEIRQEFLGLLEAVSYRQPRGEEGKLAATIAAMTDDEAARCARSLLRYWLRLRTVAGHAAA
jgi:hypothetical protein